MKAIETMKALGVTMDILKEHILGLLMCGEGDRFAAMPTAAKTMFTKAYNVVCQSSVKPIKKVKRGEDSGMKGEFDPDFMSEPSGGESESDGESEIDVVGKVLNKKKEVAPRATRGRGAGTAPAGRGTRGGSANAPAGRGTRGGGRGTSTPRGSSRGRGSRGRASSNMGRW